MLKYPALYYNINDPILNTKNEIIHASIVVYAIINNAHLKLPDSLLTDAITAIHGKYINVNAINAIADNGVKTG